MITTRVPTLNEFSSEGGIPESVCPSASKSLRVASLGAGTNSDEALGHTPCPSAGILVVPAPKS